ncbi:MAG: methylenetetrahydrofolate--tRNA-(uracil(54)-C(5))-methyltransferase (FADH(2)-oxidizing) TrmFO [Proteobacteria bacterium]|nr:methylenetetrahydrofolate--tRNA-(uracil(54)-C(5))-methyltransferase (FADH(2)-oxidizing) TrmFO [Pseudomonadota bacterium]
MSPKKVSIIGGGLAGSEAAWQLASRGMAVTLHEMRPATTTKAHKTGGLAELVCSNSFRGAALTNAVGLLKEELRLLGSLIMEAADFARVPAGGALAVDRVVFSNYIDSKIRANRLIEIHTEEVTSIPDSSPTHPVIIATGPLTSKPLAQSIEILCGTQSLAFFDAISPIILGESIDQTEVFRQSRYDKGNGDDYLNLPLSKEQYYQFVDEIARGEKFGGHDEVESDYVDNIRPFEGCMPIEEMVSRGPKTLAFGPLKPMGLTDPRTGRRPYAVVQLRQDDKEGTLWSMVGMQTKLKHPEQLRIFRMLPGLKEAEFVRLGSVHRNTFMDSPKCLRPTLQFRERDGLFFAGQITGVEGYVESTSGGLLAGINAARMLEGHELIAPSPFTALGGLMHYISDPERKEFQPMNISFGLIKGYGEGIDLGGRKKAPKDEKRLLTAQRALQDTTRLAEHLRCRNLNSI